MHTRFKGRLEELEQEAAEERGRRARAIMHLAFAEMSQDNLAALARFFTRVSDLKQKGNALALEEALAACTPDETASIDCFNRAGQDAASRLYGRPLYKVTDPTAFVASDTECLPIIRLNGHQEGPSPNGYS